MPSQTRRMCRLRSLSPPPRYTAPEPPKQPEPAPKANGQNIEEQIQACKDLLECGLLTQAEYEQKIRELTR